MTRMKTTAVRAAVSGFIFFVIALAGLSPDRAYAHEPGATRDCSAYPYTPPFPPVPVGYMPRYHTHDGARALGSGTGRRPSNRLGIRHSGCGD
jgi:hypothetical protein